MSAPLVGPLVFGAVRGGAVLHASWNAIVKARSDTFLITMLVAIGAALIAALLLPWLALPAPVSWPYIAASTVVHWGYFAVLVAAYGRADMSLAYPLMRGGAPLLVAPC